MAVPRKFFRPIHDLAEAELAQTAGSLTASTSSTVYWTGSTAPWDMQREWRGRELVSWTARASTWGHKTFLRFYANLRSEAGTIAVFHVVLDGHLSDEDAEQLAGVYMMALNLRRIE